jgi:hypothetical protein
MSILERDISLLEEESSTLVVPFKDISMTLLSLFMELRTKMLNTIMVLGVQEVKLLLMPGFFRSMDNKD